VRARVDDQLGVLDDLGRGAAGGVDRHDLVVFTVDHQGRLVELFQVVAEVGFRERLDRVVGVFEAALHALGVPGLMMPCDGLAPARL